MLKLITALALIFASIGCKNAGSVDESKIALTAEEEAYIKQNPEVRWALEDNRPPYIFIENNQVKGVAYEYLNLIAKKTGLKLRPVRTVTFLKSINALQAGQVDVVVAIRPTIELSQSMQFTLPFVNRKGVFVFRANSGPPRSPFIAGVRVGYASATQRYIQSRFPDMKLVETEDDEQALVLLQKGLVDGSLMDETTADYWIKREVLDLRKAPVNFDFPYAFGYPSDKPMLGSILAKGLESISEKDQAVLNSRWLK